MGNYMSATPLALLGVDMGLQWTGFAIASALQTEKFYDLTGSYNLRQLKPIVRR